MQPSRAPTGAIGTGGEKSVFTRAPQGLGLCTRRARASWRCLLLEDPREAHLSATPQEPHPHPWFPCTDEDGQWSQSHQQPPPQGASTPGHRGLQEVSGQTVSAGAPAPAGAGRSRRFLPSDRLRKRFEFRLVRDGARRVHTKSFVLLVAPPATDRVRLGITVSRQVGKAVRRNRIKRLVREVFRQHRELFPDQADVVVIAKNSCDVTSLSEVHAEFAQAAQALRSARGKRRTGGGT
jgi:ribonuclease P protein component